MASPPDGVELVMLGHEEWGAHVPAPRVRAPWRRPAWLRGARGRIGVVSAVLFLGLSWYFSMPSTLYLYAEHLPLPPGLWEHWHAYAHIARHTLLLCLVVLVARGVRWQPPFLPVLDALQAVAATHTRFETHLAARPPLASPRS